MLVSELTLTIAGVPQLILPDTLHVSYQANGRATLGLGVLSEDGSYVPALDAEVLLSDDTIGGDGPQFGGYIATPSVAGALGDGLAPITTTIDVAGYATLAERRFVNEVIPPGTVKAALQRIVPYLASAGVTLDPAQVDGPLLPALVYDYVEWTDCVNQIAGLSGYVWEFVGLVVRLFPPGAFAAPFNVVDGDGHAIGDVTVVSSRISQTPYANRVIARSSTAVGYVYGELHAGDGATRIFQLDRVVVALAANVGPALIVSSSMAAAAVITTLIPHELTTGQEVEIADVVGSAPSINGTHVATVIDADHFSVPVNTSAGSAGTGGTWIRANIQGGSVSVYGTAGVFIGTFAVGVYGVDDLPWTFEAGSNSLHQRGDQTLVPSTGYVILSYAVRLTAYADDLPEQAAHGVWETVAVIDTPFAIALIDFARAFLLAHTATPKTAVFHTYRPGLRPGQTLTITAATRGVNNTFLIVDVQLATDGDRVVWTVTAIEGGVYQGSWQDTYAQWNGGGTSGTSMGAAIGSGSGGSGGGGGGYFWLGGSAIASVQSLATPDWVPLDGVPADPGTQVILDTVARGSVSAVITARLRASAGTVQARLRNVSDGVTAGTSAVVGTATFQTVQFNVTLTPGSKVYQLELLPSLADVDVAGVAWGE